MSVDPEVAQILQEIDPNESVTTDKRGNAYFTIKKAIYGSIQGAHLWWKELTTTLLLHGYMQSQYDTCLYYKHESNDMIIFGIFVDDLIIGGTQKLIDELQTILEENYGKITRNDGDTAEFLSMRIIIDRITRTANISMPKQIMDIEAWNFNHNDKPVTPWPSNQTRTLFGQQTEQDQIKLDKLRAKIYVSRVAKIAYLLERVAVGPNIIDNFLRTRLQDPGEAKQYIPLTLYADASYQTTSNLRTWH